MDRLCHGLVPGALTPSASSPKLQHARGHLSEQIPVDPVRRKLPIITLVVCLRTNLKMFGIDALAVVAAVSEVLRHLGDINMRKEQSRLGQAPQQLHKINVNRDRPFSSLCLQEPLIIWPDTKNCPRFPLSRMSSRSRPTISPDRKVISLLSERYIVDVFYNGQLIETTSL